MLALSGTSQESSSCCGANNYANHCNAASVFSSTRTNDESQLPPRPVVPCFHERLLEKCVDVNCERDVPIFSKRLRERTVGRTVRTA